MLEPNTPYTFQILAINGFGDGMLSQSVMFKTDFGGTYVGYGNIMYAL